MTAIGTSNPVASATASTGGNAFEGLSSEDFLNIILTELSAQDPLEPNDTQATLDQLSSLYSIQSQEGLTESLGSLVTQNEFASASGLIGREVTGSDPVLGELSGVVSSVRRDGDDGVRLTLEGGGSIPFSAIRTIREPSAGGEVPA